MLALLVLTCFSMWRRMIGQQATQRRIPLLYVEPSTFKLECLCKAAECCGDEQLELDDERSLFQYRSQAMSLLTKKPYRQLQGFIHDISRMLSVFP